MRTFPGAERDSDYSLCVISFVLRLKAPGRQLSKLSFDPSEQPIFETNLKCALTQEYADADTQCKTLVAVTTTNSYKGVCSEFERYSNKLLAADFLRK